MIYQGTARYPVKEVILHTAATPGDWWKEQTVTEMRDEIDRWHKALGWRGIGYHFVVAPDGSVAKGRPVEQIGAHVKERNRGTIGICMIPYRTHNGIKTFSTYFTAKQRDTVRRLIEDLPGIERVSGHNDWTDAKECPGFRVNQADWRPQPPKLPHWLASLWDWVMGLFTRYR
jgi:N-acetylmuramoyl-L-alanine amidase